MGLLNIVCKDCGCALELENQSTLNRLLCRDCSRWVPNVHPSEWCKIYTTWRRIGGNERVRVLRILENPIPELDLPGFGSEEGFRGEYCLLIKDQNLMTYMVDADVFHRNFVEAP